MARPAIYLPGLLGVHGNDAGRGEHEVSSGVVAGSDSSWRKRKVLMCGPGLLALGEREEGGDARRDWLLSWATDWLWPCSGLWALRSEATGAVERREGSGLACYAGLWT